MRRLAWMDEECRCSRRSKCGGDLLTDMAALADAGHDHAAFDGYQAAHRIFERGSQRPFKLFGKPDQAFGFKAKRAHGRGEVRLHARFRTVARRFGPRLVEWNNLSHQRT